MSDSEESGNEWDDDADNNQGDDEVERPAAAEDEEEGDPIFINNEDVDDRSDDDSEVFDFDLDPPPDEEEADGKLTSLLQKDDGFHESSKDWNYFIQTLQKFPALAKNIYKDPDGYAYYPLGYLLMTGTPSVEEVQMVHGLYPDAIQMRQGPDRELPIHIASEYPVPYDENGVPNFIANQHHNYDVNPEQQRRHEAVVIYLAESYPEGLKKYNDNGFLPIHKIMSQTHFYASKSLISKLLELKPETIVVENDLCRTPLHLAFQLGYPCDVVQYILSKFPKSEESFGLEQPSAFRNGQVDQVAPWTMTVERVQLLNQLLPQLRVFVSEILSFTTDGFVAFMNTLAQNTSITAFPILKLPREILQSSSEACQALQTFVASKTHIAQLDFRVRHSVVPHEGEFFEGDDDACFAAIARGISSQSSQLRFLSLNGFYLTNFRLLSRFMTDASAAIAALELVDVIIEGPRKDNKEDGNDSNRGKGENDNHDGGDGWSQCTIQDLNLHNVTMEPESYQQFLSKGVAQIPRLRKLGIRLNHRGAEQFPGLSQLDIAEPLAKILQRGQLTTLNTAGLHVNVEIFCDALKTNQSLKKCSIEARYSKLQLAMVANVLAEHNTSLESYDMAPEPTSIGHYANTSRDETIAFYTRLNRCGRGKIRNEPGMTKREFVEIICRVHSKDGQRLIRCERLSVDYGLLREAPHLWCANDDGSLVAVAANRKRKRE